MLPISPHFKSNYRESLAHSSICSWHCATAPASVADADAAGVYAMPRLHILYIHRRHHFNNIIHISKHVHNNKDSLRLLILCTQTECIWKNGVELVLKQNLLYFPNKCVLKAHASLDANFFSSNCFFFSFRNGNGSKAQIKNFFSINRRLGTTQEKMNSTQRHTQREVTTWFNSKKKQKNLIK